MHNPVKFGKPELLTIILIEPSLLTKIISA